MCLFCTLPLGRNHEGSLKIERLIHQDSYNTPPISASPCHLLFHPISWQSDLHLMLRLWIVVHVSVHVCCVYTSWSLSLPSCILQFLYQVQKTLTHPLKLNLYFIFMSSLHNPPFFNIHPLFSVSLTLLTLTLHLSCSALCIISLICAGQADPSLPQHASIDPLPQCVCVILRCSDL